MFAPPFTQPPQSGLLMLPWQRAQRIVGARDPPLNVPASFLILPIFTT
jgi:hypothetical protein